MNGEQKKSFFPLPVIVFIIGLGLVIGLPILITHNSEMYELQKVDAEVMGVAQICHPASMLTPTPSLAPSPTATPTASVNTKSIFTPASVTAAPTR